MVNHISLALPDPSEMTERPSHPPVAPAPSTLTATRDQLRRRFEDERDALYGTDPTKSGRDVAEDE